MDRVLISFTWENFITINLMALVGLLVLILAVKMIGGQPPSQAASEADPSA